MTLKDAKELALKTSAEVEEGLRKDYEYESIWYKVNCNEDENSSLAPYTCYFKFWF